jgi:tetratricopeptide (TPR) repeat protein
MYAMGLALKRKGDATKEEEEKKWCYTEAVKMFRKALKHDPDWHSSGRVYADLGLALECVGDADGAVEVYKAGIDAEPTYTRTRNNYATCLINLGEFDDAVAQLEVPFLEHPSALPSLPPCLLIPVSSSLSLHLCLVILVSSSLSVQEAIRVAPMDSKSYFHLGVVYKDTKQMGKSIHYFQKAVDCSPDWSNGYFGLGSAYWDEFLAAEHQDLYHPTTAAVAEKAFANWEEALVHEPGHKGALHALKKHGLTRDALRGGPGSEAEALALKSPP